MHYIVRVRLIPVLGPEFFVGRTLKLVKSRSQAHVYTHKHDADCAAQKYQPFSKVIAVK
jgi:hypothetical protein